MIWKLLHWIPYVWTAMDMFDPISGSMSDEEKQFLIKDKQEFSSWKRKDNIKKSIADTKSKTLNLNEDKWNIKITNNTPREPSITYDWDKKWIIKIDNRWNKTFIPDSKLVWKDIMDLDKDINLLPDKEKKVISSLKSNFDKLKAKWVKIWWELINPRTYWELVKKNKKVALLTTLASPVIYWLLSWEDEWDNSKINDTKTGWWATLSETKQLTPTNVENKQSDSMDKVLYKWRELTKTRDGKYVFSWMNWETKVWTLDELKNKIDTWLKNYYRNELSKNINEASRKELLNRLQERWFKESDLVDEEEWLSL